MSFKTNQLSLMVSYIPEVMTLDILLHMLAESMDSSNY